MEYAELPKVAKETCYEHDWQGIGECPECVDEPISKDCKHCEHLTACWEDTAGEHKRWQCCHCGRIRSEYAPTGGHGPFLSQPRFAELKTGTPEAGVREARLSGWIGVDLDGTLSGRADDGRSLRGGTSSRDNNPILLN